MFRNKDVILNYIVQNRGKIFLLFVFLIIGCTIGIVTSNLIDIQIKNELLEYIQSANESIGKWEDISNNYNIALSTIYDTFMYFILIIILGCTVIFSPLIYLVIAYKGFSIGITMSFLIMLLGNIKASIYALISMFLPNVILIIVIVTLSIIWLKFAKDILKNREIYNFKKHIYGNLFLTLTIFIVGIIMLIPIQILVNNVLDNYIAII